jgi:hypothetical protein
VTTRPADSLRKYTMPPFLASPAFDADMRTAADLLDAIDALPDEQFCPATYVLVPHDWAFIYEIGYRDAMHQVKRLLHPEEGR